MKEMTMTQRELIILTIQGLAEDLLGADRRGDEELPSGAIESAVARWDITIAEMALVFEEKLRDKIPHPVESGYHAGQAAHNVRMKNMHAAVAEIAADG